MNLQCIAAASIPKQAWRNGGGRTRELWAWPAGDQWRVRVSLADIESDGPFSVFEDTQRWFAVVAGAGVQLDFADTEQTVIVERSSAPVQFAGHRAPRCRLIDGPTQDLNLMVRTGKGFMRPIGNDAFEARDYAQWGAYCVCSGSCEVDGQRIKVSADTLIWSKIPAAQIVFNPDSITPLPQGWWMGVEPFA